MYITLSAGWNANHVSIKFLRNLEEKDQFFDDNGHPLVSFIDRKGAATFHSFDTEEVNFENGSQLAPDRKDTVFQKFNQSCASENPGWEGKVEIHRQESIPYGWSKYWNPSWDTGARKNFLTVLDDVHKAEPAQLTHYVAGYERISCYRYLDEVEESIRTMAERCSGINGFVNFSDCFDGFSGVTNKLIEFVNDEYNRKSILFNINEPWSQRSPFSMVSEAMSLLSQATMNIPLQAACADTTESQADMLCQPVVNLLSSLRKNHISMLTQMMLPRKQNILSVYYTELNSSLYEYLNQNMPETNEISYSWLNPEPGSTHQTYSTFACVDGSPEFMKKSNDPKTAFENLYMRRVDLSEAVCMWNYNHLRCATNCVVNERENYNTCQMVSLRNNDQMRLYLGNALDKLKRFSSKLTGMEEDDWVENIEDLQTLYDATSILPEFDGWSD